MLKTDPFKEEKKNKSILLAFLDRSNRFLEDLFVHL